MPRFSSTRVFAHFLTGYIRVAIFGGLLFKDWPWWLSVFSVFRNHLNSALFQFICYRHSFTESTFAMINCFHFSPTRTSDEEDTEFGDCTVMIEDDVISASQQVQTSLTGHQLTWCFNQYSAYSKCFLWKVNGGNLKERLLHYIRNNEELYKKILRYQVIWEAKHDTHIQTTTLGQNFLLFSYP